MKQDKHIVEIKTPPSAKRFVQVTCLMTDEELLEAQLERPDLIFRKCEPEPVAVQVVPEVEDLDKGITVRGMVMPYDIEEQAAKILNEEDKVKGKGVLR